MKEKLRLPLRKPAVIALLIAELLVIGFALAAALRPAAAYTFTADQWENIAQESEIGYDEDGRIGVTEMTDGEDILQTPSMTLPKGHYKVTLDYRYVPSVWEGGVERRSCVYFTSYDAGTVTGEKPCVNVKKQQDTLTLNVSDYTGTIRVAFREPKRWLLADGVSVLTALVLVAAAVRRSRTGKGKANAK